MAYAPTLTPRVDFEPVPRVEVVFSSVDPSAERATVYRLAVGRTFRVRAGVDVYAAGGFALVDAEAPFNVVSEYRAEMFDAAGLSLGFTDPATVTLEFDGTVMHQPVDPGRAVQIDPLDAFGSSLTRPFMGEVLYPKGRTVGVFVGAGRQGLRQASLNFATDVIAQAEAVDQVFGTYDDPQMPVVCIRTQPKWRIPMPLFAAVVSPTEERLTVQTGGEIIYWSMTGDEVSPPVESLVIALLSYSDFEDVFLAYSALEAAYLTYLALESDYSMAGS